MMILLGVVGIGDDVGELGGPRQPLHVLPLLLQPAVHLQAAGRQSRSGAAQHHGASLAPERHPESDAGPGGHS